MGWLTMLITHICFRRALTKQGINPESLPLRAPLAPFIQYVALVCILFIMGCEFYLALYAEDTPTAKGFFSVYLACPLFLFDYIVYKLWCRTKSVSPADVDFSEAYAFDAEDQAEAEAEAAATSDAREKPKRTCDPVQSLKNVILG